MDKITMLGENGDTISLYVLETTRLAGVNYLLTSDVEEGDGECYILKEISPENSAESVYEPVEDEALLDNLLNVFAEELEDIDFEG